MNLSLELTDVSPVTILPMQVKKGAPWSFCASGCTFLQSAGVWFVFIAMQRAYCRDEGFPPCALSPSSDDGVGKRQTPNVPIVPLSACPESWQIVGKWLFERQSANEQK